MTRDSVRKALADLGMVIRRTEYGEWRVNFKGGSEASAYYANDLEEALATGKAMHKHRKHHRIKTKFKGARRGYASR